MESILKNPGLSHIVENILSNLPPLEQIECRNVCIAFQEIVDNPGFWLYGADQKEFFFSNPTFQHIGRKIFSYLSPKDLINQRLVCKSFKNCCDDPFLWLDICKAYGMPGLLINTWKIFVDTAEDQDLKKEVTLLIMKMKFSSDLVEEYGTPFTEVLSSCNLNLAKKLFPLFEEDEVLEYSAEQVEVSILRGIKLPGTDKKVKLKYCFIQFPTYQMQRQLPRYTFMRLMRYHYSKVLNPTLPDNDKLRLHSINFMR